MVIDVSDLLSKKVSKKEVHLCYEQESFFDGTEIVKFVSPVKVDGIINSLAGILNFDAKISTNLELTCSRCIEKFIYPLDIEIHEKFSVIHSNESNDIIYQDDEITSIEGDNIDITEIVENNISLVLPIKRLCKEDCKGLCQNCGTNLNVSSCTCVKEDVDPRLSKLKDLFST